MGKGHVLPLVMMVRLCDIALLQSSPKFSQSEYTSNTGNDSFHTTFLFTRIAFNKTLQIITGCLSLTLVAFIQILESIAPTKLQRHNINYRIKSQAKASFNHHLHKPVVYFHRSCTNQLISCHFFFSQDTLLH